MMRRVVLCLLFVMLVFSMVGAQEAVDITPVPEQMAQVEFLAGEWSVDSRQNMTAFDPDAADNAPANWVDAEGVSIIQPFLQGHMLFEEWVLVHDEIRTEGVTALAYQATWNLLTTSSDTEGLLSWSMRFIDDGVIEATRLNADTSRKLTITSLDADSFTWELAFAPGYSTDFTPVLLRTYTRIPQDADPDAATLAEDLRAEAEIAPRSEAMADFDFWIGEWSLVSRHSIDDLEPHAAYDRVRPVAGDHALLEHWVALWTADESNLQPIEAMSLTTWNADLEQFENVWWSSGGTNGFFPSTSDRCGSVDGAYQCSMGGSFENITPEGFFWRLGPEDAPAWTMEFTRMGSGE